MIALIQRVQQASVTVQHETIAEIPQGLLIFLGVEHKDTEEGAKKLAVRVANYRVFSDADDKMNVSLIDIQGQALVVSQFTLAADTSKGRRPSFSSAASPEQAKHLYQVFCQELKQLEIPTQTGQFAADMQVTLTNDGPVTFQLTL